MSIFGKVLGSIAGSIFGSIGGTPPVEDSVTVMAIEVGYFNGYEIEIGETFEITAPQQFSPYWMKLIDTPPFSWQGYLKAYSQSVDIDRIRWQGKDETVVVAPGGPFPV